MNGLPDPLRRALDTRSTESEILGVWRGVQRKRRAGQPRHATKLAVFAFGLAAVVLAVAVLMRPPPLESVEPAPLTWNTPSAGPAIVAGLEIAKAADLSDGSKVRVGAGARLAVLENSGHTFRTLLTRGRAEFSVTPGGPRRWVVDCGAATIEVVGTEFAVERSDQALRVSVQHGTVLVRGESVPDRLQRLSAGQSLELALATASPARVAAPSAAPAPAASAHPAPSAAAGPSSEPTVDDLVEEAERARRERRPQEAATLLERSLARQPRGHRASLSAFTLGRLYQDQLGSPGRAARAFRQALAAGAPADLEEDLRARLVEAHARMGDTAGAQRAAAEYRSRFPNGRRRADVDRLSPLE